ncbi:hypothetical protein GF391_03995 [Candidatus Uhrbacteria bacterium]|nr:hypothetical protein [Candidatus Uhrbacteria bacterium]
MKRSVLFLALIGLLVVSGAGCFLFKAQDETHPAGPRPADLEDVSPAEAAKRINLVKGSRIEIRQGDPQATKNAETSSASDNKIGLRIITIERFAPMNIAGLSWKLSQNVETKESISARERYREQIAAGEEADEPEIETERLTVIGNLKDINLKGSHKLFLPAYWPTGEAAVPDLSAIWVSQDVYEEITGTKNSTIYFGIMDSALYGAMSAADSFFSAIEALSSDASSIADRIDADLTSAEEPSTQMLMVNGQEVEVQVIKVRNWFGEITVLDNPQNPLILKMAFSTEGKEALKNSGQADFLKSLIGYEVTQLNGVQ